jgi:hypothetical protein
MGGEDIFSAAPGRGIHEDARPWLDLNTDAHMALKGLFAVFF